MKRTGLCCIRIKQFKGRCRVLVDTLKAEYRNYEENPYVEGKAIREVKEAADDVTKTNDEDGVAYYLEKLLLGLTKIFIRIKMIMITIIEKQERRNRKSEKICMYGMRLCL